MRFQPFLASFLPLLAVLLAACGAGTEPTPAPPPEPLVVLSWAGYMPQSILDAFEQEYAIPVQFLAYADQDEAIARIQAGEQLDVVILGDAYIPGAVEEGLLAELDFANIPNFRNLGPSFRDLAYDPENRHSIMIQWGTTGLVVRTDRLVQPVTSWADLWNPAYAGRIGVWPYKEELIGIALKSLGYPLTSEDPGQLQAAEEKLLQLRKNVFLLDPNLPTGASFLQDDQTVMIYGWSYDAMQAQKEVAEITYVLPAEGTMIWTDSVTVPANSARQEDAELFINFLLRAEISAQLVNELWIPSPNEAARSFIKPEILSNLLVYPSLDTLKQAEFYSVASEETQKRYDEIWQRFLAAEGPGPRP